MYLAIESRSASDHTLHFSSALLDELRFWYCNIDSFYDYSLRLMTILLGLPRTCRRDMFTAEGLGQSSTFRELKAIYYVLLSCAEGLKRRRVKVFKENQGTARI